MSGELVSLVQKTRRSLSRLAAECARQAADHTPVVEKGERQDALVQQQEALTAALAQQFEPLRAARAVGARLEAPDFAQAAEHAPDHPLVVALATLDHSIEHVRAHPHWRDSSQQLAEMRGLRGRALQLCAAKVSAPLVQLAEQLRARAAAAGAGDGAGAHGPPATCGAASAAAAAKGACPPGTATAPGETEAADEAESSGGGEAGAPAVAAGASEGAIYVRFGVLARRLHPWAREVASRAAEDDECLSQLRDLQMTYWRLRGQLSTPSLESALRANLARYGAEACYALRLVPSPRPEPTQHSPLLPCRHKHA